MWNVPINYITCFNRHFKLLKGGLQLQTLLWSKSMPIELIICQYFVFNRRHGFPTGGIPLKVSLTASFFYIKLQATFLAQATILNSSLRFPSFYQNTDFCTLCRNLTVMKQMPSLNNL